MWRELLPNTAASRDAAVATASTALWATAAWLSADVAWSHGKVSPTWNASADSHEKELPPQSSRHAKQLKRPTPVPEGPQAGMAGMQHSSVSLRVSAKAEAAVRTSPVCVRKKHRPSKPTNKKKQHKTTLSSPVSPQLPPTCKAVSQCSMLRLARTKDAGDPEVVGMCRDLHTTIHIAATSLLRWLHLCLEEARHHILNVGFARTDVALEEKRQQLGLSGFASCKMRTPINPLA